MAKKTIFLCMSFIALTFSASMLYGQDSQQNDQPSKECTTAQSSQSEADIQKCLQGDLTQRKDALVKKFKEIRPLRENQGQQTPPDPTLTPAPVAPVQPVTPVQPVVQPAPAPAEQAPRVNPYSY